jgi:DNA-binding transcriptional regulator LsrR (DeoR family)
MLMSTPQRGTSEGSLLSDDRFLRRVAHLYYADGHTQEEIAGFLYCSRQTVGKALQRAEDRGMVRISVVPEERTGYLHNLAHDLRFALGLDDLVLVPGRSITTSPFYEVIEDVIAEITSAAAEYLDQLLVNGDVLAVSGGRTIMRNIVRYLKPDRTLPDLQVLPTIGFVESRISLGDSNLIAYDIATAYGAKHAWLPIPAIVETAEQRALARGLPLARDVFKMMEQANIIMTGIWYPQIDDQLVMRRVLSQQQVEMLQAYKPVADINHWVFTAEGRCINTLLASPPYYLTGLEIPHLPQRIKQEKIKVILVAGASRAYIPALLAVLRAGIANILITDHVTAELLRDKMP